MWIHVNKSCRCIRLCFIPTVGLEEYGYLKNMERWEDSFYAIANSSSVVSVDFTSEISISQIDVPECQFPRGMKNLNQYFIMICSNSEDYEYNSTVSLFQLIGNSFVLRNMSSVFLFDEIQSDIHYYYYDNFVYFHGRDTQRGVKSGIFKTNFTGIPVVVKNSTSSILIANNELYFSTRIDSQDGSSFKIETSNGSPIIDLTTGILDHYVFKGVLYFTGDCGNGNKNPFLCKYEEGAGVSVLSEDHYYVRNFFEYNNHLFFTAEGESAGSELYMINGTHVQLVTDIWRGARSGKPNTFINIAGRSYLIASNIYVGSELFSITERPDCSEENVIICTNVDECDEGDGDTTVVYVGDVTTVDTEFTSITVIEGNLIGSGTINFGLNTTVLGSVSLVKSSILQVNSSTKLTVRDCISTQNSSLIITLTEEELQSGSVSVLDGVCINGNFNVSLLYDDPCSDISINEENYGKGLSVSFEVTSSCFDSALIIGMITIVSILVLVGVLVILLVPPIHAAVFPHRKKSREHQQAKTLRTKRGDSDSRDQHVPKSRSGKGSAPA
eukprot:TRINITY_DN3261_c0_g1_i2.p1 TRINITY_DN3261_c0_g1~~TRINITY_DN3261_c0_g1_i2.p1  ORF type:complete len:556 (+),score=102.51 TRINITY_DN3261_c0_g1_i2:398-2065(+)